MVSAALDPAILAALADDGAPQVIETHGAWVVLARDRAFKLKKPVALGYLDFSTVERRAEALAAELRLNQPGAPMIYKRLGWLTRTESGGLALDGGGDCVEPVLVMSRFGQDQLLDRLAQAGPLEPGLARDLALAVRRSHETAQVRRVDDGAARLTAVLETLCTRIGDRAPDRARLSAIHAALRARLAALALVLDARGRDGFVRRCHGDLHLGNLVLIDDQPVLFDALEFDEDMATIDLAYDLAFLVMDLAEHGQSVALATLLSTYFAAEDAAGAAGAGLLAPLAAIRALVRLLVTLDRGGAGDDAAARTHLQTADRFSHVDPPRLIAIGGLSGTGKSTLAMALAPRTAAPLGALVIRADLERKAMFGAAWDQPLPTDAYAAGVSERVYERMRAKAGAALAAGANVILDAVHARPDERDAAQALAARLQAPFTGLWLQADPALLKARVSARTGDASDADARVVALQTGYDLGEMRWRSVDASGGAAATLTRAAAICGV